MLVIFDMDGTIFDSESVMKKSFATANKQYNIKPTERFRQSLCGKNENTILAIFKQKFPDLNVTEYREYLFKDIDNRFNNKEAKLKPGFLDLVNYLKSNDIKLALATGAPKEKVDILFKNVDIEPQKIFDTFVYGNEVKVAKPEPDIFLMAAEKLSVNPNSCYVIEDSDLGIYAAYKAKMHPIMVLDIIKPNKKCKLQAEEIFDNLNQVKNYIFDIINKINK